jgi:L-malate glycosyltransferase
MLATLDREGTVRTIQVISPMWPSPEEATFGIFVKNACDALERRGFSIDARAVIRGPASGLRRKAGAHLGLGLEIAKSALAQADCIYLHAPTWFGPLVQLAALPKHKPIIIHMHGDEVFPWSKVERFSKPAVGWMSRLADLIVVPSEYYGREVERAFHVPKDRIFVSPSGGVDLRVFRPLGPEDRKEARRSLGIALDAEVIGYIGRITEDKGWDTFIDVVARLAPRLPRLVGLVLGEGAQASMFETLARATGVDARIVRRGFWPQAELLRAYGAMDAFVFATRRKQESLGLAPIEALACGVPVVGSRISAVPEYVLDGESGFLANPLAADDFAAKVARILETAPADREALRAGARRIAERFDAERVASDLAGAITRIIDRGRGARH